MSNYSYVDYVGDGSTNTFSIPFPYLSEAHIKIYINDVLYATGSEEEKVTWSTPNTVILTDTPSAQSKIRVKRETPRDDRLVDYQNAGTFNEAEMDKDSNQLLYIFQETSDFSNVIQAEEAANNAAASAAIAQENASISQASVLQASNIVASIPNTFEINGFIESFIVLNEWDGKYLHEIPRLIQNGKSLILKEYGFCLSGAIGSSYMCIRILEHSLGDTIYGSNYWEKEGYSLTDTPNFVLFKNTTEDPIKVIIQIGLRKSSEGIYEYYPPSAWWFKFSIE